MRCFIRVSGRPPVKCASGDRIHPDAGEQLSTVRRLTPQRPLAPRGRTASQLDAANDQRTASIISVAINGQSGGGSGRRSSADIVLCIYSDGQLISC